MREADGEIQKPDIFMNHVTLLINSCSYQVLQQICIATHIMRVIFSRRIDMGDVQASLNIDVSVKSITSFFMAQWENKIWT